MKPEKKQQADEESIRQQIQVRYIDQIKPGENSMTAKPSIFDKSGLFTEIPVELQFRDRVVGGTPKDPKVIDAWIRKTMGISDETEARYQMVQTLIQLGVDLPPDEQDMDIIVTASAAIAGEKKTQGFKYNLDVSVATTGLYIEGRHVKAMLKESVSCLYISESWGMGLKGKKAEYKGKARKSFFPEHVFIRDEIIPLGVDEPTGVGMNIGHVDDGRGGKRATLSYYEYVEQATIAFTVLADRLAMDAIAEDEWVAIWTHAQENGLGAMRGQGFGKFNVTRWGYEAA